MSDTISLRPAEDADKADIRALTTRAFGQEDEAKIIDGLEAEGASYLQVVALRDGKLVGHVLFYHLGVLGRLGAIGLGPMSVDPDVQRQGIGTAMARHGLKACEDAGVPIVFVLGHKEYYPRLGFSHAATRGFESPWSLLPSFMALRMKFGPPMSGRLMFPKAFGA